MKIDKRSAMVKCPTCNQNQCTTLGYAEEAYKFWLEFLCGNQQCPEPKFRLVFRSFPDRTIMDTEFLHAD